MSVLRDLFRRRDDGYSGRETAAMVETARAHAQRAAQDAMLRHYRRGLADGVDETLDQLEGRSAAQGPVPELTDELREWIARVRANSGKAEVGAVGFSTIYDKGAPIGVERQHKAKLVE